LDGPIKAFAGGNVAEPSSIAQLDESYIKAQLEENIRSMAWFSAS
jgi:hypothetical protein